MLTRDQQNELDRLEARNRKNPARTAVRRTLPAPAQVKMPDVHVHVDFPEQKQAPERKPDPVIVPGPRKWLFEHKYNEYGRLIQTTATAQ